MDTRTRVIAVLIICLFIISIFLLTIRFIKHESFNNFTGPDPGPAKAEAGMNTILNRMNTISKPANMTSGIYFRIVDGIFTGDTNIFNGATPRPLTGTNSGITTDLSNIYTATNGIVPQDNSWKNFSVEWNGEFLATATGTWTFYITGGYLWIGGNYVYTNNNALIKNVSKEEQGVSIDLVEGKTYNIHAMYGQSTVFSISYSYPNNTSHVYNGLVNYYYYTLGRTQDHPAPNALAIKAITSTNMDDMYWITLPTIGAKPVYCIMNSAIDGGGWMMGLKAVAGSTTFNFSSAHWTAITTLNPTLPNRSASEAKFDVMNYFPAKDLMALWPDIPANYGGGNGGSLNLKGTYNAWCWLQNKFNLQAKPVGGNDTIVPIKFFADDAPKYVCQGKQFSGWGTPFSSQAGHQWFGFNYKSDCPWQPHPWPNYSNGNRSRIGFGFNNEGDSCTNDLTSGIGLGNYWRNWSAGDVVNCCQDRTGINRSARVELYFR